ncbi:hypothetical protein BH11PAT1_BH11PAT1_1200 [soil metagenome]
MNPARNDAIRLSRQDREQRSAGFMAGVSPDTDLLVTWIGLPKNKIILEVNPNSSRLTLPLAEAMKRGRVYTLTDSQEIANRIQAQASGRPTDRLRVGTADIQTATIIGKINQFIDGQPIDIALLWDSFSAIQPDRRTRVLRNLGWMLKPGGSLLLRSAIEQSPEQTEAELNSLTQRTILRINEVAKLPGSSQNSLGFLAIKAVRDR